jgi:hypothetical protein
MYLQHCFQIAVPVPLGRRIKKKSYKKKQWRPHPAKRRNEEKTVGKNKAADTRCNPKMLTRKSSGGHEAERRREGKTLSIKFLTRKSSGGHQAKRRKEEEKLSPRNPRCNPDTR